MLHFLDADYGDPAFAVGQLPFGNREPALEIAIPPTLAQHRRGREMAKGKRMPTDDEKKYLIKRREMFQRGEYLSRGDRFTFFRREAFFEISYEDEEEEVERIARAQKKRRYTLISACVSVGIATALFVYAVLQNLVASWLWEYIIKGFL